MARRIAAIAAPLTLVLLWLASAPSTATAAGGWSWPVRGSVIARFHVGRDPFAAGQHRGIDIAARPAATVRAACPGRVAFAGAIGTSGPTVAVDCAGLTATYVRLGSIATRRGAWLDPGDAVGAVSVRGFMHFGVHRTGRRFAYLDPLGLLGGGSALPRVTAAPLRGDRDPPAPVGPASAPEPVTAPAPAAARPVGRSSGDAASLGGLSRTPPVVHPGLSPAPTTARSAPDEPRAPGLPLGALWLPCGIALVLAAAAGSTRALPRRPRRFRRVPSRSAALWRGAAVIHRWIRA